MSNIVRQGEVILSEDDYKIIYQNSHVVQWSRQYDGWLGMPTNAFTPTDFGTPQEAIRCLPGLREEISRAAGGADELV